jgi:hypothetical protein
LAVFCINKKNFLKLQLQKPPNPRSVKKGDFRGVNNDFCWKMLPCVTRLHSCVSICARAIVVACRLHQNARNNAAELA